LSFRLGKDDYLSQIAPARTFLLEKEAQEFQARGLGKHLTNKDMLVMGADGPIENKLRFADEHVRHKICDLIGDLALLGRPLRGRVVAYRSGHDLNHALVRKLSAKLIASLQSSKLHSEPVLDIRRIMRLLPHRYPFLMVDRIVEIDGDRRAVALKNVTINEPYFQGHFPHLPIMPGVMIIEAMAQLSGILLSQRLEHTGKVAMLLSMDRVKIRRPVRPGDQLIIHAESLHVRSRTGHCRCTAFVGPDIAAEAEIKFMLVDAEPI
jgi:UDP-3-O-[3-hydroxymyristoyl] N-acetylglucosamine deacetylase/3-hydroxyacyl-[acyl-carrier-protein] dehydratase